MLQTLLNTVWFICTVTISVTRLLLIKLLFFVLKLDPSRRHQLASYCCKTAHHVSVGPDEFAAAISSWSAMGFAIRLKWEAAFAKCLQKDSAAPNVQVYRLCPDGSTTSCLLLDFAKQGRPLVINFGSST